MQEKKTQEARVIERLRQDGEVTNFWAIHNYILRLGAIIFQLRKDGWFIDGAYGTEPGDTKNFHYTLVSEPFPKTAPLL
jgi:hypothetical protein